MSESESTYQIQGSRVYGQGMSINCTNKVTAEQLCNRLNNYEREIELNNTIGKDLKIIIMDLKVLKHDIKVVMNKLGAE